MWRWQQSVRNRLWRHIIASCALIHGILLCLLFLVYRGTVDNYLIYTASALTTQHVILLPLHKVVGSKSVSSTPIVPPSNQVLQAIDAQCEVERKTPVSESRTTKSVRPEPVEGYRTASTTTLASSNKKKLEKKKRTKKNARDKKSKKNVREKKNKKQTKEKEAAKPEVKKIEEKKVEEQKPALAAQAAVPMTMPADAQSALYVGQLEYEALQLQEAVQQELQQHWKPPIGSTGLTCVVRIMLDWQGAISDVIIEQPSGVLLFDMSAEQAIYVMTFPKTAWGKQVTITFS